MPARDVVKVGLVDARGVATPSASQARQRSTSDPFGLVPRPRKGSAPRVGALLFASLRVHSRFLFFAPLRLCGRIGGCGKRAVAQLEVGVQGRSDHNRWVGGDLGDGSVSVGGR